MEVEMYDLRWKVPHSLNYAESADRDLVSNLSKPEERGRVSGTYNAVQSFGAVLGSALTGVIVTGIGYYADFFIASMIVAIGLFIFLKEKSN